VILKRVQSMPDGAIKDQPGTHHSIRGTAALQSIHRPARRCGRPQASPTGSGTFWTWFRQSGHPRYPTQLHPPHSGGKSQSRLPHTHWFNR
jgi:hypothetical protein